MDEQSDVTHLLKSQPYYTTRKGAAYQGDSRELLEELPEGEVDLIVTSPPFALRREKAYGNESPEEYNEWFMEFAEKAYDVLADDGSMVIDIGGGWTKGVPTRSTYHFELLMDLVGEDGPFHLAQEMYWYNPAKLPTPAQWVTIERIRLKDAVNHVWWLSKTERPDADNKRVLKEYSDAQKKLMEDGYKDKMRPSEHNISDKFDKPKEDGAIRPNFWDMVDSPDIAPDFSDILHDAGVSDELIQSAAEVDKLDELARLTLPEDKIPDNVLKIANTASNTHYLNACKEVGVDPHPARFPRDLPQFFIQFLTEKDDLVLDIFAGSNMSGWLAEQMGRDWLAFEYQEKYLRSSKLRFLPMEELQRDDNQQSFDDVIELTD
ncbi:site-specific DNA-methyltransferase [Haloarcula sp. Atlit-47R]|uniref:DNA-methyltransferase n=1 Tax=Haloarcula sp. Atlit-47R TaxID=2282132 RepID=UPI000EF1CF97|nr:site-specific DNA-methyltransferase [Haloarcula sp. Atlit-47R]RLM47485.1 site-specific DNA-methyltransferase [Haloarcula sp. Atlit-47R]